MWALRSVWPHPGGRHSCPVTGNRKEWSIEEGTEDWGFPAAEPASCSKAAARGQVLRVGERGNWSKRQTEEEGSECSSVGSGLEQISSKSHLGTWEN